MKSSPLKISLIPRFSEANKVSCNELAKFYVDSDSRDLNIPIWITLEENKDNSAVLELLETRRRTIIPPLTGVCQNVDKRENSEWNCCYLVTVHALFRFIPSRVNWTLPNHFQNPVTSILWKKEIILGHTFPYNFLQHTTSVSCCLFAFVLLDSR